MAHGGRRPGAGRPANPVPTKRISVPENMADKIYQYVEYKGYDLPVFRGVSAGVPTAEENYPDEMLNLNDILVRNPESTFMVYADGDSMIGAGIQDNDLLMVDRTLPANDGKIVIAAVDGDLTVKRLKKESHGVQLLAENPKYDPICVGDDNEFTIWGVVTSVIHRFH